MTLTPEQSALLCAPFASQDHEFKPPRGYIYIAEIAICQRIEQVDLSWELRVEDVTRNDPRGALATSIAHLTICGITRSGVGMQAVEFQKGTDVESGEAEKGATTDAMKRAARLFGIGRYLLDCPKGVKDYGPDLDKWLKSLSRQQQAPAPMIKAPAPIEPHWSTDQEAVSKMYDWAQTSHYMSRKQVDSAITATGQTLSDVSKAEAMGIITRTSLDKALSETERKHR